jgi:hypothetical protein
MSSTYAETQIRPVFRAAVCFRMHSGVFADAPSPSKQDFIDILKAEAAYPVIRNTTLTVGKKPSTT